MNVRSLSDGVAVASLAVLAGLLLYCVGRPIFTDDLWWHLALGRAYLEQGLWLPADPLLFAAEAPPAPAAWLFDVLAYGVLSLGGFTALRLLHVAWVLGILLATWGVLRACGATRAVAAAATATFLALSAYRLFQLRPELATILGALAVWSLLLAPGRAPGWRRGGLAVAVAVVWANLHAAFLLGPILLGGGLLGAAAALPLQHPTRRPAEAQRLWQLGLIWLAMLAGTLCNPQGVNAHLAYFAAGEATPELSVVGDEWVPLTLLSIPSRGAVPGPLIWGLVWLLLVGLVAGAVAACRSWRDAGEEHWIDPALLALAAAGLVAPLIAIRFAWLGIFALLLVVRVAAGVREHRSVSLGAGLVALLLLPAYLWVGDWAFLSRGVPRTLEGYREPYAARKYFARATWFLRDTGVEGRVFTSYDQGGFYGFWLAPRMQTLVNGTLNLPRETFEDYAAIQTGHGITSRRELLERLAAHDIDFFVGVGLPQAGAPGRPWRYTAGHLRGAPGWLLAYRSLNVAVYVRSAALDAIDRIADYHASRGVPFDRERGLDLEAALRTAPGWAIDEGVVPMSYSALAAAARGSGPSRSRARSQLANLYAGLGLHELALAMDAGALVARSSASVRRRVWLLLQLDRFDEALNEAHLLGPDPVSQHLARVARELPAMRDPEQRALLKAFTPLFSRAEAGTLASGRTATRAREAADLSDDGANARS